MPVAPSSRAALTQHTNRARGRAAGLSISVALTLLGLKLITAVWTGSLVIISSCLDSLLDVFTSTVNWIVIRTAQAPPDKEHPFGHGKAEYLGGLFQGLVIGLSGLYVLGEAVQRFREPVEINHTGVAVGVMAVGSAVSAWLVYQLRAAARRTDSPALRADSAHYLTDVYTNAGALIALAFVAWTGNTMLDTVAGFAIAALVLWSAADVCREAVNGLMDHQLPDHVLRRIRDTLHAHPSVVGIHDLRARQSGADKFVQVHVEMDGAMSFDEAHAIAEELTARIEGFLQQAFVIVHADPVSIGPDGTIVERPASEPPAFLPHE